MPRQAACCLRYLRRHAYACHIAAAMLRQSPRRYYYAILLRLGDAADAAAMPLRHDTHTPLMLLPLRAAP